MCVSVCLRVCASARTGVCVCVCVHAHMCPQFSPGLYTVVVEPIHQPIRKSNESKCFPSSFEELNYTYYMHMLIGKSSDIKSHLLSFDKSRD